MLYDVARKYYMGSDDQMERINFFSCEDGMTNHFLSLVPTRLDELLAIPLQRAIAPDDAMELFSIQKYLECPLLFQNIKHDWLKNGQEMLRMIKRELGDLLRTLPTSSLVAMLNDVDVLYREFYWEFLLRYGASKRLSNADFAQLLRSKNFNLRELLTCKMLVEGFSQPIREHMFNNPHCAEVIIDYFETDDSSRLLKMPQGLTTQEISDIINRYVDLPDAHPNYLRIIFRSRKQGIFALDENTKLKAKTRLESLYESWRQQGLTDNMEGFVTIDNSISEGLGRKVTMVDGVYYHKYSRQWIAGNLDYPTLLNNFIYLFNFTNQRMMIWLASRPHENDLFDVLSTKSKFEYSKNDAFRTRNASAIMSMNAYYQELLHYNICLEDVIAWFFHTYLPEEFDVHGFTFHIPNKDSSYLDKIRSVLPEIESILHQFRCYLEKGKIDDEVIALYSDAVEYADISSQINGKYAYLCDENTRRVRNLLFSDQSILGYLDLNRLNLSRFIDWISEGSQEMSQKSQAIEESIDWLIMKRYIMRDSDGKLLVDNKTRVKLMEIFLQEDAIPILALPTQYRFEIERMLEDDMVYLETKLFARQESDYFNYMLKSKYNNGPTLRNKYIHGTQGRQERYPGQHHVDYMTVLVMLILVIIKINDDFCLQNPPKMPKKEELSLI